MTVALVCLALCMLVFLPVFGLYTVKKPRLSVAAKGLATVCALVPAVLAACAGGGRLWLCAAAILCCAVADVLLELQFMLGLGMFICGHLWFIGWFLGRMPLTAQHALIFIGLLCIVGMLFLKWRKLIGDRLLPFGAYALVLCVMGATGIACSLLGSPAGILTACGAACFIISDAMVCRQIILPSGRVFGAVTMVLYEAAQFLFAFAAMAEAGLI